MTSKPTETELLPERIVDAVANAILDEMDCINTEQKMFAASLPRDKYLPSMRRYALAAITAYVRHSPTPSSAEARERAREIVNEYAERQPDSGACPHCGEVFANERLRDDKHVPTHDWPKPCRQVCPGTGQFPVPDPTPLIDAIASAISTPQPTLQSADCKLGEPLMHGDKPYRWCETHEQLMLTCERGQPTLQQAIEKVKELHGKLKKEGREWWDERGDDRAFLMAQGVEQAITALESLASTDDDIKAAEAFAERAWNGNS